MGMANHLPEFLTTLAEMLGNAGQPQEGLNTLQEALEIMNKSDERYYEAELYRVRGELLLMLDASSEPEARSSFYHAVEVARRQNAKLCELRATASLCRLWLAQKSVEKRRQAHEMLNGIYSWFTEGFDTPDLEEARTLLDALA